MRCEVYGCGVEVSVRRESVKEMTRLLEDEEGPEASFLLPSEKDFAALQQNSSKITMLNGAFYLRFKYNF